MTRPAMAIRTVLVACGVNLLWGRVAWAHSVDKRFGDFYGGVLHPLTALEHLLPIVALGLWAGQQKPTTARWALLFFPLGMLLGAIAGVKLDQPDWVVGVNRASFIVLGLLVVGRIPCPTWVLGAVGLAVGGMHGFENTFGLEPSVTQYLFIPGVAFTGLTLLSIVAALVVSRQKPWQQVAVRVVGSWITAVGILLAGLG